MVEGGSGGLWWRCGGRNNPGGSGTGGLWWRCAGHNSLGGNVRGARNG